MKDYLEISKQNVRGGQIIAITIALIFSLLLLTNLIVDFSPVVLLIFTLVIGGFYFVLIKNKSRDIYYENGKIYLSSLFHKEVYDIAMVKGVYTSAFLSYSIKFQDGKEYYFRLLIEDVKLLFKSDPDFYAKRLNSQLLDRLNFHQSKEIL